MQPDKSFDELGHQFPFSNVQQHMFYPASIDQPQQQHYGPLQHLQSHYGQTMSREVEFSFLI